MAKTIIVWFSATGNTLYLAKRFQDAELIYVDELLTGTKTIPEDTERLGILFPVYGNGLPFPMRIFIQEYLAKRDNSHLGYIFSISTNGGSPMGAEWNAEKELQDIGLALSYSATVKLPDGYLPLLKNSPDEAKTKEMQEQAEFKIQKILKDVENEEIQIPHRPLFALVLRKAAHRFNRIRPVSKRMSITDKCNGCSICSKVCPMDNITIQNGKASYGDRCLSCFACYHHCPQTAITFGKVNGQYKGLVETKELFKR